MTPTASSEPSPVERGQRRVVLVAGPGRSGTSAAVSTLAALGYGIPGSEVAADASNPRGFGESRWVVRFNQRLLRHAAVRVGDPRPWAERLAGEAVGLDGRDRVARWLDRQLARNRSLVVKDPRLVWALAPWQAAATDAGADVAIVTMLRHPAAVGHSRATWYRAAHSTTRQLAAWVNAVLITEASTRHGRRALLAYDELVNGWRLALARLRSQLGTDWIDEPDARRAAVLESLLDPALRRSIDEWPDDVDDDLRSIAATTWTTLLHLASQQPPDGHDDELSRLDECRRRYAAWYDAYGPERAPLDPT